MKDLSTLRMEPKSVINISPPRHLWEALGQRHKTQNMNNLRSGPHMTFVDPFIHRDFLSDVYPVLQEKLASFPTITITYRKFGHFKNRNRYVLFLEPEVSPAGSLDLMLDEIESVLPQCNKQRNIGGHGYQPHLTLRFFNSEKQMNDWLYYNEPSFNFPIQFDLFELHFLLRVEDSHCFRIMHTIQFGEEGRSTYFGENRDKSDDQVERSVVLFNLPQVLQHDETLRGWIGSLGFEIIGAEVLKQKNGDCREFAVIEFVEETSAKNFLNREFSDYPELDPVEFGMTIFPDVVGGTTTVH